MSLQREAIQLDAKQSFRLLHWKDNLREVDSLISPTQRLRIKGTGDQWHYHQEMELTLVQRSHGTRFVGDHIGPFEALDIVLIGSHVPHFWKGLHDSTGYALQWHFPEDHALWQLAETEELQTMWKLSAHGLRFTGETANTVLTLVESMRLESGMARLNLLFKLFLLLARAPRRDVERLSKRPFDLSGMHAHQPAIERAIRHVLQHFREPLPLNHILKLSGMSKATFSRQFKKHAGKPFTAFVNRVRLDAACRELVAGNDSIGEVAFANGFNSLSYFNRVFRSAMKCNPKDYRKRASR